MILPVGPLPVDKPSEASGPGQFTVTQVDIPSIRIVAYVSAKD